MSCKRLLWSVGNLARLRSSSYVSVVVLKTDRRYIYKIRRYIYIYIHLWQQVNTCLYFWWWPISTEPKCDPISKFNWWNWKIKLTPASFYILSIQINLPFISSAYQCKQWFIKKAFYDGNGEKISLTIFLHTFRTTLFQRSLRRLHRVFT